MADFLQDSRLNSKIELVEKGKILKCNTRTKQVRFRLTSKEYEELDKLRDNFKLRTISQAIRHMIKRWYEVEQKTIIERQRLAEEAAKIGARII